MRVAAATARHPPACHLSLKLRAVRGTGEQNSQAYTSETPAAPSKLYPAPCAAGAQYVHRDDLTEEDVAQIQKHIFP